MAEEHHETAAAFEKAVDDAMAKFKASYEGAPPEKTHLWDALEVVKDLQDAMKEIWSEKFK